MLTQHLDTFVLDNFEGPIEFLLHLIQKEELSITGVPIYSLIEQFIKKKSERKNEELEIGTDFLASAAYLILLKSRSLLPVQEQTLIVEEQEEDLHFEVIHHLIDYCRFKEAAKSLAERQDLQEGLFPRGITPVEWKKPLGIEHLSIEDLASLVQQLMKKTTNRPLIHEEPIRVSDKIGWIRAKLTQEAKIQFNSLFIMDQSRLELIVTFLAILELMKMGEVVIGKETANQAIFLFANRDF